MLQFKISNISPSSPGKPGSITVSGNVAIVAKGRYYFNQQTGDIVEPYATKPTGYDSIQATTFEIIDNTKFAGRYTVYTPTSSSDFRPSVFDGSQTQINVVEAIPSLTPSDNQNLYKTGSVVRISTYEIKLGNNVPVIIPPNTVINKFSVPFIGKTVKGWGEDYNQTIADLLSHRAGQSASTNPSVGEMWYDSTYEKMRVKQSTGWYTFGNATSTRVMQETASKVWTIKHNLVIPAPFICTVSAFVVRDGVYRTIIPSSIEFTDANTVVVKFTKAEYGAVIVSN